MQQKPLYFYIFFLLLTPSFLFSQNLRLNHELNFINEQSIASDSVFHFTIKPYTQKDISKFKKVPSVNISKTYGKLMNEHLINVDKERYFLNVNPIIHSQISFDTNSSSILQNYRGGINLNLKLKDKLFFASDLFYSRISLPNFRQNFADSFGIIPHYGKFLSGSENSYKFLSFTGELTYHPSEYINFHLGNGKHFFGNGYRSLFLSDNSASYPYFKTTVDIWKIKYVWLISKLSDFELYDRQQSFDLYKKAAFTHYFSLNITNRINFNFFETIISNPYDHNGNKAGYEAGYFNPVIFYRPVEFYSGTSDNSLMGLGLNLRLFNSLHLYSQFILDDLIISKLKDGSGWWGNKFGIQTGMKAYNFLNVEGLFFRGELNLVRPYTYFHGVTYAESGVANINYGNMHQNLAHPMGANFAEAISVLRYKNGRFISSAKVILSKKGIDNDTTSFGNDIYNAYNLRPDDYGITFLQGEMTNFAFIDVNVSYIVNPNYNLKFELGTYYRKDKNSFSDNNNLVLYFGLSSNLFNEASDF